MEQGGPQYAHFQSLRVRTWIIFPSADFDEHYSFNLGARNCFNSNAGAKHIYLPISDWLGGNVFLLDYPSRWDGGYLFVCVKYSLQRVCWCALFP